MATYTRDGFPGQRMRVLPRPLVGSALRAGLTERLLATDAGYFPHAANHGRSRPKGAPEAVVLVCIEGRGWCDVGGSTEAIGVGQALVLAPGTPHLYRADRDDPWTLWWFHAAGSDVPALLGPITGRAGHAVVDLHDPTRVVHTVEQVVQALERDETRPVLMAAAGAAWNALAQIGADRLAGPRSDAGPVQRAREYLLEHLDAPVRVPEVAAHVGLSASHLAALFRRATGGGVLEYVKSIRMARARVLLMTTSLTVAEVAREVGYPDAFYFSRQFRAVSGSSPSQFRKASRADHVV
ncbi:AraC family transcriptional regulator [Occultella glacieicola]|uniref:AraC family transcriptional regulator n=1 Tax=Occultella glacieicola TaxID=2518684 RepID=A0ABY2E5R1_9MICO|nr:AraC family transcriptional regulator [Occultella glacieicola]TDE95932.1 AraC family transcriptional regulator [Occultella glacieicola]